MASMLLPCLLTCIVRHRRTRRYLRSRLVHSFDPGLFAGLNVLPKCTAMSTYAYSLDDVHLLRLQQAFVHQAIRLGLYDGRILNLDFHTAPHFGDESVLEKHWAGARNQTMKGALCLFTQDAASKLMLYTAADIHRDEASDQVLPLSNNRAMVEVGRATQRRRRMMVRPNSNRYPTSAMVGRPDPPDSHLHPLP